MELLNIFRARGAEIECEGDLPRHRRHAVRVRIGEELSDREHGLGAAGGFDLLPELFQLHDKIGSGQHRVAPEGARHGGRVGVGALAMGKGISRVTANDRGDGDRQIALQEERSLFDVQFVIGGDIFRREVGRVAAQFS